jgi:site-specific DNA-cytosine methylase
MKALIGFAGFGGPEIALREAGIQAIGIEKDPAIAEVNRINGGVVITADILGINPAHFIDCGLTHFSPPCPSYSVARNSKSKQDIVSRISDLAYHQSLENGESELDIRFARKICEFLRVVRPEYFTLENVWGYRKSRSWLLIWYTLLKEGYGVGAWNLNSADYGVPQTRRRMIVIGRRDGRRSAKPWPTHSKTGDMFTVPWRGWYEAIEDLTPGLPESQFARWQMDRLPPELKACLLVMTGNTNRYDTDNKTGRGIIGINQPANTVAAQQSGGMPKAFILAQGQRSNPKSAGVPADTVTANNNKTGVKAFIVGGQYQSVFCQRFAQNRTDKHPVWTIVSHENLDTKVCQRGKVVSLTPRCLARFQDFPDTFILPGDPGLDGNKVLGAGSMSDRELACRGIGNALPPGVYRAILRTIL